MPKITINLLPDELKILEKEKIRKVLITKLAIGVIIIIVVVALITFSQSLLKKNEVANVESSISQAENRVRSLSQQEGSLSLLKTRLSSIKTMSQVDLKVVNNYDFILSLIPPDVTLKTFKVARESSIGLSGVAQTGSSFSTLLENLAYSNKYQDKIAKVNLQNLIKSKEGLLSFEITVTLR